MQHKREYNAGAEVDSGAAGYSAGMVEVSWKSDVADCAARFDRRAGLLAGWLRCAWYRDPGNQCCGDFDSSFSIGSRQDEQRGLVQGYIHRADRGMKSQMVGAGTRCN